MNESMLHQRKTNYLEYVEDGGVLFNSFRGLNGDIMDPVLLIGTNIGARGGGNLF